MKNSNLLEVLTTKYIVLSVLCVVVITIGSFIFILFKNITDINTLATFVDAVFKTIAILVGAIWGLNRYFASRTDAKQIKVDPEICIIRDKTKTHYGQKMSILLYRLDVVNTGKTLLPGYFQKLEIEALVPNETGISYKPIHCWPPEGLHTGGPIEPGSWSAINDAVLIESSVKAVRFYMEIHFHRKEVWTWHKTFDISKSTSSKE